MAQEIDYGAVLADLEARRAALDGAIAVLRQLVGTGALEAMPTPTPTLSGYADSDRTATTPADVPPGLFHGLSVSEAARKFLEMTKKKQRMVDIVAALRQGGIEGSTSSFYGNVFTTLMRRKDFLKLGKYWALAEWYPNRVPTAAKKSRRGRKGRKGAAVAGAKPKLLAAGPSQGEKAQAV